MALGGEAADFPPGFGVVLVQEVIGQQGDVLGPFPQGGHDDLQHAQAEIEVAAETPFGHVLLQVAIGGGDHADIDVDRLAAADALEGMPFQHAEELGLDAGAHLADFVEHEGALVGGLELADLPLRGPGEGAALVAEQLAGQQFGRQRRAVQADEDAVVAGAGIVDGPGDQLLAHAALAANEHGGVAGGGPGDLVGHLLDGRAVADHVGFARPAARGVARSRCGPG